VFRKIIAIILTVIFILPPFSINIYPKANHPIETIALTALNLVGASYAGAANFTTQTNFAYTTLASPLTNNATIVYTFSSSQFPQSGTFIGILWSQNYSSPWQDASAEIIHGNYAGANSFIITRAQEGTQATSRIVGDQFSVIMTAGKVLELENAINSSGGGNSGNAAFASIAGQLSQVCAINFVSNGISCVPQTPYGSGSLLGADTHGGYFNYAGYNCSSGYAMNGLSPQGTLSCTQISQYVPYSGALVDVNLNSKNISGANSYNGVGITGTNSGLIIYPNKVVNFSGSMTFTPGGDGNTYTFPLGSKALMATDWSNWYVSGVPLPVADGGTGTTSLSGCVQVINGVFNSTGSLCGSGGNGSNNMAWPAGAGIMYYAGSNAYGPSISTQGNGTAPLSNNSVVTSWTMANATFTGNMTDTSLNGCVQVVNNAFVGTGTLCGNGTSVTLATNLSGGLANEVVVQKGANNTGFIVASVNSILTGNDNGVPIFQPMNGLISSSWLTGVSFAGVANGATITGGTANNWTYTLIGNNGGTLNLNSQGTGNIVLSSTLSSYASNANAVIAGNVTLSGYTGSNQNICSNSAGLLYGCGAANGSGSMIYPPAGIPQSSGISWLASFGTSGAGNQLALASSPVLTGTPTSSTSLGIFPVSILPSGDTSGTTDTNTIQSAINSLPANGGTVQLLGNSPFYVKNITLGNGTNSAASTTNGMKIIGHGGGGLTTFNTSGVQINCVGTSGACIQVSGPVTGWGLEDLTLNITSSSSGYIGVQEISGHFGHVRNVSVQVTNANQYGITETTQSGGSSAPDTFNSNRNIWDNITVMFSSSATNSVAVKLYSGQTTGGGGSETDPCFNTWNRLTIITAGATGTTGLWLAMSDSNTFNGLIVYGDGTTNPAIYFDYSQNSYFPNDNHFFSIDTGTHPLANSSTAPTTSSPNIIYAFGTGNGGAFPNIQNLLVDSGSSRSLSSIQSPISLIVGASAGNSVAFEINNIPIGYITSSGLSMATGYNVYANEFFGSGAGITGMSYSQISGLGSAATHASTDFDPTGAANAVITAYSLNSLGSAAYTASTAYSPVAGSASIATVGTITSGTWHGTAIDHTYLTGIAQADVSGLTTGSGPTFSSVTATGGAFAGTSSSVGLYTSGLTELMIISTGGTTQLMIGGTLYTLSVVGGVVQAH
jgi:hypothetical protein